jgi:hypothetical protein
MHRTVGWFYVWDNLFYVSSFCPDVDPYRKGGMYGYAMTSAFPCVYSQCSQLNKALPFPPSCYNRNWQYLKLPSGI